VVAVRRLAADPRCSCFVRGHLPSGTAQGACHMGRWHDTYACVRGSSVCVCVCVVCVCVPRMRVRASMLAALSCSAMRGAVKPDSRPCTHAWASCSSSRCWCSCQVLLAVARASEQCESTCGGCRRRGLLQSLAPRVLLGVRGGARPLCACCMGVQCTGRCFAGRQGVRLPLRQQVLVGVCVCSCAGALTATTELSNAL
jgi:hypothetical protein